MNLLKEHPNIKKIQSMAKRRKVEVYLVGGFLRDQLIQKDSLDFDFALSKDALKFARSFSRAIKGAFVLLDEERGCARVCKKTTQGIATYDFADFRTKTFNGDISKRDFTINTLAVRINDLKTTDKLISRMIDLKGGIRDIKAKRIKMVFSKTFKDDPLRILRAYSLNAQLKFKIDVKTLAQMKRDKKLLKKVSPERVREELFKILSSSCAGKILKHMDKSGILEEVIPQIQIMYQCKQGTYHHLDVWPHSLETVVQLDAIIKEFLKNDEVASYLNEPIAGNHSRASLMKLAALLHDIGKPDTRARTNGRVSFHGHEHVGKTITRHVANMLKLSSKERVIIENIVRWHLRPGYLSNFKKPTDRAVFRYFRDTQSEAVSILLVSLADQRSTRGPATTETDQKHHEKICRKQIKEYFKKKNEKPIKRLITGADLIKSLKLKPSPAFSRILSEVEEQHVLGKISTKKEALALGRKIVKKEALKNG